MSDMKSDRVDRHRDEGLYSERIQKDKQGKEKFTRIPDTQQITFATFFNFLKNHFENFTPSKQLAGKVIDKQTTVENLHFLKNLLKNLGEKNLSTSSDFTQKLSNIWSDLLEDFDNIEISERKNLEEVSNFRQMMDKIKNFPPDSEHRLGYYLLLHAGKDWIPFPYIEILEKLHNDHVEDPKNSTLSKWFSLIDSVIASLKQNFPFKGF